MAEDIPPHIWIRGEEGAIFKLALPLHEAIEQRMQKGYIVRVNADGTPYTEDKPRRRPPVSDSKAAWVGWAVTCGMTPDDAEAATKTDLIERFGTDPAPDPADGGVIPAPEGVEVTLSAGEHVIAGNKPAPKK